MKFPIPIPAPLRKLAMLHVAKETVGVATGAVVVTELDPQPASAKGEGFFVRVWNAIKDAPKVPGEVISALRKIQITPESTNAQHAVPNIALHASLTPSDVWGSIFIAGSTVASLLTFGAIELTGRAIAQHRLGGDIKMNKLPRRARREIMQEVKAISKSLSKDDPEHLRPTLELVERIANGEGGVGIIVNPETGEKLLTLDKKPVSSLSALPASLSGKIEAALTRHAADASSLTADALRIVAHGTEGHAQASYNRLMTATGETASAVHYASDPKMLAAFARPDPEMMFGGQIQSVSGNTPAAAVTGLHAAAQEKAAAPAVETGRGV